MSFGRKSEDVPAAPAAAPVAETPAASAPAEQTAPPAGSTPAARAPAPARRRTGGSPVGGDQLLMRLVATAGIVGIGVAIGAILVGQNVAGWVTGLVVSLTSMVLMAIIWGPKRA